MVLEYRREIDGLRAVAVLPVVFFHAGLEGFSGGYVGVDIFFVISGYLITSIILKDLELGRFSISDFYERRARRILPALYFVLLYCVVASWFILLPTDLKDFYQSLVSVQLYVSNFFFYLKSNYFDVESELRPLLHTWSLAVEEQYYIVIPFLLWFIMRHWKFLLLPVLIILTLISFIFSQWVLESDSQMAFYMLPSRAWELLIGSVLAVIFANSKGPLFNLKSDFLSCIGLGLIVLSVIIYDESTPFPGLHALLPIFGAILVIVFCNGSGFSGRILCSRLAVWIGLISYSLYLWHQPVFAFFRYNRYVQPTLLSMIFLTIVSFFLAWFTWKYVEAPFRNRAKFSRYSIVMGSIMGSVLFLAVGSAGHITDGFASYVYSADQKKVFEEIEVSPFRKECHPIGTGYIVPEESCTYHNSEYEWAVFGNSHSVELAAGLADWLHEEKGEGVRHFTISGCYSSDSLVDNRFECVDWFSQAIEEIATDENIKNVLVSFKMTSLYRVGERKDHGLIERNWQGLIAKVDDLVASGKTVYFVHQVPNLPNGIESYIRSADSDMEFVPAVSREDWQYSLKCQDCEILMPKTGVKILDPVEVICDEKWCPAVLDGKALYFDDNHMSVAFAKIIVDRFFREPVLID